MIDNQDIERLKEIFVTREECSTDRGELEDRVNNINVDLAVIKTQLKTIQWLLTTVGAGVIATLVKVFLGG